MQTSIRLATTADIPGLDLHDPFAGVACNHAVDVSSHDTFFLVAENDGHICGHAYVRWSGFLSRDAAARYGHCVVINGLAVWPESIRRHGLGSGLLEGLEQEAIVRQCERIALGVNVWNKAAIAFYVRHGYRRWPGEPFDVAVNPWIAMGKALV